MSTPNCTGVNPLNTLLCGDPSHTNVNREAERQSRQYCLEPKALKLRSDGTPYSVHASTAVLRGGNQTNEEVTAKEKKIARKFDELPMSQLREFNKRKTMEGRAAALSERKPTMELKMPVLDAAARSTPSVSDGKVSLTTPKKVTFAIPDRTKSAAVNAHPASSSTPIYEAEMAKKAGSTTARPSDESKTQRPAIKLFSSKTRLADGTSKLAKTPAVTPKTAESTMRSRQVNMRAIYDRDPRPLILPQDCEVPRRDVRIVEMPVDGFNGKGKISPEKVVEFEDEWVAVGKEDDEEWQIV